MSVSIVGIDCATDPKRCGLALGSWHNGHGEVLSVATGNRTESIAETIMRWLPTGQPVLLSMDAPLGWPAKLGQELVRHVAGEPISVERNELFRRTTDRAVRRELKRQPLDVGADRIARTAHSALEILGELRSITRQPIPLAWGQTIQGICAIEVYPAATLTAYGILASGYKGSGSDQEGRRARIVESLRNHMTLRNDIVALLSNDDMLDAVICVLAAADFLLGEVVEPADQELAKKEGWIWFRPK